MAEYYIYEVLLVLGSFWNYASLKYVWLKRRNSIVCSYITDLLTNFMQQSPWEDDSLSASQEKFSSAYRIQRLITVFTKVLQWS
jgi:hypothetical protein